MGTEVVGHTFTAVLLALGFALGLYTIVRQVIKDRIRLTIRIVPGRQTRLDGTRYRWPWIEVANLGANPVWVNSIGIKKQRGESELLAGAVDQENNPPPWSVFPGRVLLLPLPLMPGDLAEIAPVAQSVWVNTGKGQVFSTSAERLVGYVQSDEEMTSGPAQPRTAPAAD